MHFIDVNKINFLAGVECALRDICFENFVDEDPVETCGEQYQLPFDSHEISLERQHASQFFDALPMHAPDFFDYLSVENRFEACQELAWQYIRSKFHLDIFNMQQEYRDFAVFDENFDETLEDLIQRQFNCSTSVFIGTGLDGQAYIFIE